MTQTWEIQNEESLERAIEELTRNFRSGSQITLSAEMPDSDKGDAECEWRRCMAYEGEY